MLLLFSFQVLLILYVVCADSVCGPRAVRTTRK